MNQNQEQENQQVYHHTNRTHKYPNISKNGCYKYSETKIIQNIIFQCEAHYPSDLQCQAELIVNSLQQQFDHGHCLNSINAKHVVVDYKQYTYLIWQVLLDQNFE